MNKVILKRIIFIFASFIIGCYSLHSFSYNFVYDKEHKIVVEQSLSDDKSNSCNSHSKCSSEHELHKPFLNVEFHNVNILLTKIFYTSFHNYFYKISNNLIKPPIL